jgi:hypothetical protein
MRRRRARSVTTTGAGNENDSTAAGRGLAAGSKNRTITGVIKRMFKAAAKALAARDGEAQSVPRKRKSGEKESGAPIHRLAPIAFPAKVAARERYAGLRSIRRTTSRLLRKFSAAADDAALPELSEPHDFPASNTLEWLNQWSQENATLGHGLDDHSDTQQNRDSPHP